MKDEDRIIHKIPDPNNDGWFDADIEEIATRMGLYLRAAFVTVCVVAYFMSGKKK